MCNSIYLAWVMGGYGNVYDGFGQGRDAGGQGLVILSHVIYVNVN